MHNFPFLYAKTMGSSKIFFCHFLTPLNNIEGKTLEIELVFGGTYDIFYVWKLPNGCSTETVYFWILVKPKWIFEHYEVQFGKGVSFAIVRIFR